MQAVRQIIDAERLSTVLTMPENMRQGQVEIIVFPVQASPPEPERQKVDLEALDKLCGSLHKYANPALIPFEKTRGRWL
jgi:hypothetical protein